MATINFRPNPAQDSLAECRQAGWLFLSEFPNYNLADWQDKTKVGERLLDVAEAGAKAEPTLLMELGVVAITACTDKNHEWMILPVSSWNNGQVIIEEI